MISAGNSGIYLYCFYISYDDNVNILLAIAKEFNQTSLCYTLIYYMIIYWFLFNFVIYL